MRAADALPVRFNAAAHFVDRNVAEGRGPSPAFLCEGQTLTYDDLHALVNRTGNALRSLGARVGDRVLMICLDAPEFLGTFWGPSRSAPYPCPSTPCSAPRTTCTS
jgi:4-hydroxybenzoate-CoA ligase/benzoate-CoA ligase